MLGQFGRRRAAQHLINVGVRDVQAAERVTGALGKLGTLTLDSQTQADVQPQQGCAEIVAVVVGFGPKHAGAGGQHHGSALSSSSNPFGVAGSIIERPLRYSMSCCSDVK